MNSDELLNQSVDEEPEDHISEGAEAINEFLKGMSTEEEASTGIDHQKQQPTGDPTQTQPPEPGQTQQSEDNSLAEELERAQAALDRTTMTPQEQYKSRLKEADITLEEAREIIDCVMVQLRPWRESLELGMGVNVTFKTRMPADIERLRSILEKRSPKYQSTREFMSAKHNIAASLVRYGDHEFDHETEEGLKETIKWLRKIPVPVFTQLQQKLYEFDQKMNLVFSPGYTENF